MWQLPLICSVAQAGDDRNVRVYRDPAVVAAEQAQREAARDGHRQLWVALMAGAPGCGSRQRLFAHLAQIGV